MTLRRHDPTREIVVRRDQFAELARRLIVSGPASARLIRQRFEHAQKILAVLGPDATLGRGYSVTTDAKGNLVCSVANVKRGMRLHTRVRDGEIESTARRIV
jgi:exodeoxyribonuclease VII large subunit